ncbi:MAG: Helix-turn-helix domain protein [Pelotomaculum sp. PtaB.Bin104]|nr:MAG: Helix-turn-helix domain protein [Pelotomaculum sp. PtaB.Bin104]
MSEINRRNAYLRATLTAKEAAGYLGISYWLLLELVKRKEVPAIHAGRRILFRTASLDAWMDSQEKESVQEPAPNGIRRLV